MHLIRKISAFLFLGIFSMFMLHQVLPHVHHQHDGLNIISANQNEHLHHHQDHHHDNEEDVDLDLFDFLLGNHTHSYHNADLAVKNIAKWQIRAKDISIYSLPEYQIFSISDYCVRIPKYGQDPPNCYYLIYLSSLSLRGPPSLG